jgi:hypothetical protein
LSLIALLVAFASSGCVYDELTSPHTEPGGTVTATLNGGAPHTSTGLGMAGGDPFSLSGFSPILTFGLTAPSASTAGLAMLNTAIELDFQPGGSVQLEIHADGTGCSGQVGVVHLHTGGNTDVAGDFSATGVVPGTSEPCTLQGTLDAIPVTR